VRAVAWWLALWLVWVASLTTGNWPELAVGAVVAGVCVVIGYQARRALGVRWWLRRGWLRGVRLLPWTVLTETFTVWRAAARRLRHGSAPGETRELPLRRGRSRARQTVAVLLLAATPGTVVVDVDRRRNVVLLHGVTAGPGPMERAVRS
jgi:multisubunit Na+/H+ antiporter MnhE subunit